MQTSVGTVVCEFRRNPAICLREQAIFVKSYKCPYHVKLDLDLDLEHILDAGPSGAVSYTHLTLPTNREV